MVAYRRGRFRALVKNVNNALMFQFGAYVWRPGTVPGSKRRRLCRLVPAGLVLNGWLGAWLDAWLLGGHCVWCYGVEQASLLRARDVRCVGDAPLVESPPRSPVAAGTAGLIERAPCMA